MAYRQALTLVLGFGLASASCAADPEAGAAPAGAAAQAPQPAPDWQDVRASRSGREYRVFLSIPSGEPPPRGFPVVYLLDASWYFEMARATESLLGFVGEMPRAVIVGIGYSDPAAAVRLRFYDFTHPNQTPLPQRYVDMGVETGGADDFTDFLRREVHDFVAEHVAVDPNCSLLIGHSLGGIYALDILANDPGSYSSYAIGEAAVWWDDHAIGPAEQAILERAAGEGLPQHLFMAYSTDPGPDGRPPAFVRDFASFAGELRERGGDRVDVAIKPYAMDGHNSMVPGFISTAMHTGLGCANDD